MVVGLLSSVFFALVVLATAADVFGFDRADRSLVESTVAADVGFAVMCHEIDEDWDQPVDYDYRCDAAREERNVGDGGTFPGVLVATNDTRVTEIFPLAP